MRLLAYITLLVALGSAGWAAQLLWEELHAEPKPQIRRSVSPEQAAKSPELQPVSRQWPALFGEPRPPAAPEPPAPQREEPQPPPKVMPPLESLGYTLTGVVELSGVIWAMISHPSGDMVLREGDALIEGMTVTRITKTALWVKSEGGEEVSLGFPQ
ncbi:type II secretion system protein N [Roseovarius aestuariivivens]|uniref:type II secretion system protein N n=1 Tax=Roseovarius aestuariivivens TaxID=1888910 RepID=UPI0010810BFE|nr:type II secretion system protein N [Roseovarius aestuariivivens]